MNFNGLYLVYVPVAVAFVAFVIYGGLVMPAKEMRDSLRHDRPRGPDAGTGAGPDAAAGTGADAAAEVIEFQTARTDRKAAA
ncbi:hypothetical protein [Actinomadura gamaensis]|uniref:Uncharacterized protein n=1 Tax=Actinomadura gamaensis TaxID=1763541 RepID=A0ABV9U4U4_9ACTN